MWTLPPCTCPRDDSGDTRGCEKHDPRSDWNQGHQFYTEGVPCESCGHPADERIYDAYYDLWLGTECDCAQPNQPVCPDLQPLILECTGIRELLAVCNAHREKCSKCGDVVEMPVRKEIAPAVPIRQKEAA